jgi:O-antigen/teichoic acid export membrane protein
MAQKTVDEFAAGAVAAPAGPARQNLTRLAALNTLASGLDYAARIVVGLLLNPLLLRYLGSTQYGIWQLLERSVGYLATADGRPLQALKWVVANKQHSSDDQAKRQDVGSAVIIWLLFLPVLMAAGLALVWFSAPLTKATGELIGAVQWTTALLILNFLLTSLVLLPDVVLRGMNLSYKRMGVRAGLVLLSGMLTALFLWAGGRLVSMAAAQLLITLLSAVVYWRIARRYVPWFGIARPTWAMVRSFFGYSAWLFATILTSRVVKMGDVIILGLVLIPDTVTTYVLTNYPITMAVSVTTLVTTSVLPGLGGLLGQAQYEKVKGVRAEMMAGTWLLATAVGAAILVWNRSFITLWVGAQYYAGSLATLLMVLSFIQLMLLRNDDNLIDISLNVRRKAVLSGISAVVIVALSLWFTNLWGIVGLCLGFLVGQAVMTVAYPYLVGKLLNLPLRTQIFSSGRPLLITIILLGLAYYLAANVVVANWFSLGLYTLVTLSIALAVGWFIGLPAAMRRRLWQRTQPLLRVVRQLATKAKG